MLTKPLVLVTGASGFLASHVVKELLNSGYNVRGTARGRRLTVLRDMFSSYQQFEAVEVQDITADDLSHALAGVGAVVHVASPLYGRATPEETIKSAVEGTLNVLRQAISVGARKFVMLSTWGTTLDPACVNAFNGSHLTQSTWGEASKEDALEPSRNPFYVYLSSKTLAERAAWEFAAAHPELDFATINPPWVYGPHVPGYTVASSQDLGTDAILYEFITGKPGGPLPAQGMPWYIDVRDLARAHVAALEVPPAPAGSQLKRYFITAGTLLVSDAVKCIAERRPELKGRLPSLDQVSQFPATLSTYDIAPALKDLRLEKFLPLETTVIDTIDTLVAAEKGW